MARNPATLFILIPLLLLLIPVAAVLLVGYGLIKLADGIARAQRRHNARLLASLPPAQEETMTIQPIRRQRW